MHKLKTPYKTLFAVNTDAFLAICFGLIGWHIYPDNLKYWGFGLIAILLWLSALGLFIRAVKRMFRQKRQDLELIDIMKKGQEPQGATLSDEDYLKQSKVMYDD